MIAALLRWSLKDRLFVLAAALLLLMALPGYLLMRRAKAVDAARAA